MAKMAIPLDEATRIANAVVADLEPHYERVAVAGSLRRQKRTFGSVVGLAVMGALVNNATGHGGDATNQALTPQTQYHLAAATVQHIQMTLLSGIHAVFLAALLAAVLGLLVLLFLPGGSVRDHAVRETAPMAPADGALRPTVRQDAPQRAKRRITATQQRPRCSRAVMTPTPPEIGGHCAPPWRPSRTCRQSSPPLATSPSAPTARRTWRPRCGSFAMAISCASLDSSAQTTSPLCRIACLPRRWSSRLPDPRRSTW